MLYCFKGLRHLLSFPCTQAYKKREELKTMSPTVVRMLVIISLHISVILASDSDPLLDFCIPNSESDFRPCKNPYIVTTQDFVFSGIKFPGNFTRNGFASISVNSNTFPGLNTLGASLVRADFDVGGVNIPHYHPRATEVAFVLKGKIYSGFVDTRNRVFAKVLDKGDVMVFPRGLLHFQMNVGDSPATILGSFNSQNPGLVRIPKAVFGSGIKDQVLEKAFGLSGKEIGSLRRRFVPSGLR